MGKDSFVFYRSFYEQLGRLPDEQYCKIMKAICSYAFDGDIVELDTIESVIFGLIKPQIDANIQRYQNGCKGAEFGKLGGRPKKSQENPEETPRKPQENPTETPNDNVNVNVNDNIKEKKDNKLSKKKSFVPPTLEEVQAYAEERGRADLAKSFYDYFSAGDWIDSNGAPVKNWKQKFITWETHNPKKQQLYATPKFYCEEA